jgi:Ca2+-binding EF-hand superfamily protein
MRECLKRMGKRMSEGELQELMKQLDSDGNGVIDFEEFLKGMVISTPEKKPPLKRL